MLILLNQWATRTAYDRGVHVRTIIWLFRSNGPKEDARKDDLDLQHFHDRCFHCSRCGSCHRSEKFGKILSACKRTPRLVFKILRLCLDKARNHFKFCSIAAAKMHHETKYSGLDYYKHFNGLKGSLYTKIYNYCTSTSKFAATNKHY